MTDNLGPFIGLPMVLTETPSNTRRRVDRLWPTDTVIEVPDGYVIVGVPVDVADAMQAGKWGEVAQMAQEIAAKMRDDG